MTPLYIHQPFIYLGWGETHKHTTHATQAPSVEEWSNVYKEGSIEDTGITAPDGYVEDGMDLHHDSIAR